MEVTIELAWNDAKELYEILDRLETKPEYVGRRELLKRLKAVLMSAQPARRVL